ncbi:hypothetical protein ACGFMK_28330 [Amycolatopsis sp. NPDC049252]|uniref:hypothetical protein n=1 Tax=Amycolatopsis sp. NPDC049252 TaxID=3363933 RepID=UPI003724A5D5
MSEKTWRASPGMTTSLKVPIAVWTIAGAQTVFRPSSNRWAGGSAVSAAASKPGGHRRDHRCTERTSPAKPGEGVTTPHQLLGDSVEGVTPGTSHGQPGCRAKVAPVIAPVSGYAP